MIVADKKVLEANLKKGALAIQYKLVFLHTENLNSLATNAALLCGLALVALVETAYVTGSIPDWFFGFIYYILASVSLVSGLLAYTQGSVEVIWGPIVALSGSSQDEVSQATRQMKVQEEEGVIWGAISCITLILSMWIFILAQSGPLVGIAVTLMMFFGLYMIVNEGKKAVDMFTEKAEWKDGKKYKDITNEVDSDDESSEDEETKGKRTFDKLKRAGNSILSGNVTNMKAKDTEKSLRWNEQRVSLMKRIDEMKGRGYLWTRSMYVQTNKKHSDCFHKGFIAINGGKLDMYEAEEDYTRHRNPCNKKPVNLSEYKLELDPSFHNDRKIAAQSQSHISATSTLRGALVGTQEISFQDAFSADFDIQFASKHFKFSLIPKNLSELSASECFHFMAEDEAMMKQWVSVLRKIISTYREIDEINERQNREKGGTIDTTQAMSSASATLQKK